MNYLVIYPGRFHPFHRGHFSSYEYLTKKYGPENVYIATSDVQAPVTSPFNYADKVEMMTKLGIPASHIVKVKNPYQVAEITDNLPDPENTALIYAVSEKDRERFKFGTKKNGEPSYLQPIPENLKKLQPLTKHAYVDIAPTVNFKVKGVDADSASAIRTLYIKGNDNDRNQIIADLYGQPDPALKSLFDKKLGVVAQTQQYVKEARYNCDQKKYAWLQKVLVLEQQAHLGYYEELIEDYIDEKTYKNR